MPAAILFRMGFADDMEEKLAATQRQERESATVARDAESRLADLQREFIGKFSEATDFLRQKGLREYRVVTIQRGTLGYVKLERVYPYSALDIGGWFLHDGMLQSGRTEQADVSSVLRGIRKRDLVVNANTWSVTKSLRLRPKNGHFPEGAVLGELCVVTEYDGATYEDADTWLLAATEERLRAHRGRSD